MLKKSVLPLFFFLTVGPFSAALAAPTKGVVILSLDGGKPSVLQSIQMPTLMSLVQAGAYTWTAQTIDPSLTLPSHTSMLTGVEPSVHKILWNERDKKKASLAQPTIFSLAKANKFKTALFAAKEKFWHLNLLGSLDSFYGETASADFIAEKGGQYLKKESPDLLFVHFAEGDSTGHQFGWGSEEQKKAFAAMDLSIKKILDAIKAVEKVRQYNFIISADHGGHEKTHGSKSLEDKNIPWIAWGPDVKKIALKQPVSTMDTAATALKLLSLPVPNHFKGKIVTEALKKP